MRKLEVLVDGDSIGEVTMKVNGRTTIVEGVGIISTGEYSMEPREIIKMVYRRVQKKYSNQKVEINYV